MNTPTLKCLIEKDCAKDKNTDNLYSKLNCVKLPDPF